MNQDIVSIMSRDRSRVRFWEEFSDLLIDDPEDEHRELIGILRTVALDYFKSKGVS